MPTREETEQSAIKITIPDEDVKVNESDGVKQNFDADKEPKNDGKKNSEVDENPEKLNEAVNENGNVSGQSDDEEESENFEMNKETLNENVDENKESEEEEEDDDGGAANENDDSNKESEVDDNVAEINTNADEAQRDTVMDGIDCTKSTQKPDTEPEKASKEGTSTVAKTPGHKTPNNVRRKHTPRKRPHNRRNRPYRQTKAPEPDKKSENIKVTWRGHAEETAFSLPVTSELLKKNPLDKEVPRNPLGSLGRHPRSKMRDSDRAPNWSNLVTELEERKEVVEPPSVGATTRAWYEMPHATLTADQIRDLRVIENRQHIDPKRFYKSSGTGRKRGELPEHVQFGTVIEGAHEFYSSRLTKRERRTTFTEEVMADDRIRSFTKRRNSAIQKHATRKRRVIDPAASKKRRYN